MAVASRGHYCSSLSTEDVLSLGPRSRTSYLNTDWFIFRKHSESSDSSHFPCVCVLSTFQSVIFFSFSQPLRYVFQAEITDSAVRLLNSYFFTFCGFRMFHSLFVFFAQSSPSCVTVTPARLYLLLCASFLLTTFSAQACFSLIILRKSVNIHLQWDSMLLRLCGVLLGLGSSTLSNYFTNISQLFSLFLYIYYVSH